MLNAELIKKVIQNIPELNNNIEANAIVSHTLNHPWIEYPGITDAIRKQVFYFLNTDEHKPIKKSITFIDLFAGIGGFRQAFTNLGCDCLFSCEWDEDAKKTYYANYGEYPYGDIRDISPKDIPDHDILCAGFPCQPFSIAGVSKKQSMGLETGFKDKAQGTLFFEIYKILKIKRPKAFFLENVKNLLSHDKGNTWQAILRSLTEDLNYSLFYKIVDGKYWVPQHRERIFMVGFDRNIFPNLLDFKIPTEPSAEYSRKSLPQIIREEVSEEYSLKLGTWNALQRHKARHSKAGNGFGYKLLPAVITEDTVTSTLSARYYKDGAEILVPQSNGKLPRKITIEEAMELQGFDPDSFVFPVGKAKAYKQLGNSVVVPAVQDTAKAIIDLIKGNM